METRTRDWLFALLILVVAGVCVRLGFWQVDRLEERRAENEARRARLARAPMPLGTAVGAGVEERAAALDSLPWRRVAARGVYDYRREVVLSARSHDGIVGVYVVTPLQVADSVAVPVLRGWLPAPGGFRAELARGRPEGAGDTTGVVGVVFPGRRGGRGVVDTLPAEDGPHPVLAELDPALLDRLLPYRVAPFYLHLPPDTTAAAVSLPLRLDLPALDDGPHLGYAIQWFGFAAIALVGGGAYFWRRKRAADEPG